MRGTLLLGLVLIAALASGCTTAVGNYFGNRARDFGECFRLEVRAGVGLGAGVRAAGLVDAGLLASGRQFSAVAWQYGDSGFHIGPSGHEVLCADVIVPGWYWHLENRGTGSSYGIPSALWSVEHGKTRDRWLWAWGGSRHARLHAFDVELYAHAAIVGAVAGFSPGELLDFLLGWFGLDIAGDDHVLAAPVEDEP